LTKELNDLASYDFNTGTWESLECENEKREDLLSPTEDSSPNKSNLNNSLKKRTTIVAGKGESLMH